MPEELYPYIKKGGLTFSEEFVQNDISGFIYALTSLPPNKYGTRAYAACTSRALRMLCCWALSADKVETCQERLTAIKNGIEQLLTPSIRQEVSYWFKKGLSSLLFCDGYSKEKITMMLENGAYIKSCSLNELTLFHDTCLDEALYKKLKDAGLNPNDGGSKHIAPLFCAIAQKADTAFDTLLRHGANIHIKHTDGGNCCVKIAIEFENIYALRKLLHKGVDINLIDENGKTLLDFLVDKGIKQGSEAFYMLLGQQPSKIPQQAIPAFDYDPAAYNDLLKIKDHKDIEEQLEKLGVEAQQLPIKKKISKKFRKWLYDYVDYPKQEIKAALHSFGSPEQLKDGIPRIQKNTVRFSKMQHVHPAVRPLYVLYAHACVIALERCAEIGFLHLLTICAQQRVAERWMFEKGRTAAPKNQLRPYKAAQSELFEALKKYSWAREIPGINTAFVPADVQDNLYKIVSENVKKYGRPEELPGTKKALKKRDLKIVFNPDWPETSVKIEEQN